MNKLKNKKVRHISNFTALLQITPTTALNLSRESQKKSKMIINMVARQLVQHQIKKGKEIVLFYLIERSTLPENLKRWVTSYLQGRRPMIYWFRYGR